MIEDISVKRGDTMSKTVTFTDANDTAINISGWSIWMTIKTHIDDTDADKVLQVSGTLTTPLSGIATIIITAAQAAALSGTYYYDVQYKKSDGTIGTALCGKILFDKDIMIGTT